jgi:hypothetical protein
MMNSAHTPATGGAMGEPSRATLLPPPYMERSVRFGDHRSCETEGRLPRFERQTATREREPDLSHRLITMLANEVHTLRKENAKLRARAKKRHKEEHRDTVDEQAAHRGRADEVAAATAGGFQRFLTEPLGSPLAPPPRTRREWPDDALRHMPFLRHYRFRPEEQLLVDDFHTYDVPFLISIDDQRPRLACVAI